MKTSFNNQSCKEYSENEILGKQKRYELAKYLTKYFKSFTHKS